MPQDPLTLDLHEARPRDEDALVRQVGLRALLGALGAPTAAEPVRVGPYALLRPAGAGGMGTVWLAQRAGDAQPVALKLLHPDGDRARFHREAELLALVDHPRVVRLLDRGTTAEGRDWLAMAWLEGEDLAGRLRRGPLSPREAMELGLHLAEGLGALHAAGLVHRDLKPANVFLVGGQIAGAMVVDLGVARAASATGLTSTGSLLGTPAFMAPEQIAGRSDPRTDIWALGATLFAALEGRAPFEGLDPHALLSAALCQPPPALSRSDAPPGLDALIGQLLARDPTDRPPTMGAVALSLAGLLADEAGQAVISRAEQRAQPATAASRTDKPHPVEAGALLGRARELGRAQGQMDQVLEEGSPGLFLVIGPSGAGRSSLLAALASRPWPGLRLVAQAQPAERGLPYALLRRLLGGPDWLDPALLQDPADPRRVADRIRLAWAEQIEAWGDTPVLLIVDDAEAIDPASARVLPLVLARGPRLLVLSATEPPRFLPSSPPAEVMPLPPLPARWMERIAQGLDPDADPARVALAEGRPGRLSALLRREVGGGRYEALPEALRRLARAAALAGNHPEAALVASLLGEADVSVVVAGLGALRSAGLLNAAGAFPSEAARAAVLDALTPADRQRAARHLAELFAQRGRHADQAAALRVLGEQTEAARALLRASRAALAGGEEAEAESLLDEAAGLSEMPARGETDLWAEIDLRRAELAYWRGAVPLAAQRAGEALGALIPGTALHFEAVGLSLTAAGQLGDEATVQAQLHGLLDTLGPADGPRTIALCRALTQLSTHSPAAAQSLGAALPPLSACRDPEVRAWLARARASLASPMRFDEAIEAWIVAHRAHLEAGDPRAAAQVRLYLGSFYAWSGAWEAGLQAVGDALHIAARLGADYLHLWGRYVEGKLWVETAPPARARLALEAVAQQAASSPRIAAGAHLYAALAALREGRPDLAQPLAEAAAQAPSVARPAAAVTLLAQGESGRVDRGLAQTVLDGDDRTAVEWGELLHHARIEAAVILGQDPAGEAARAVAWVEARAATLGDPLRRDAYRSGPHRVRALLARAGAVLAGVVEPNRSHGGRARRRKGRL